MNLARSMLKAVLMGCLGVFVINVFGDVKIMEGKWSGPGRNGEDCYFIENDAIKVAVLKKGAYVISVIDKKTGGDFINNAKGKRGEENGIYDRVLHSGGHSAIGNRTNHFAVTLFDIKKEGEGTLVCSAQSAAMRIDRKITLDPDLPKLRMDVKYTSVSDELLKTQIYLIAQLTLGKSSIVFNQSAVMPSTNTITVLTFQQGGYGVKDPRAGWWFIADRDSKKSMVMTHPVDPARVKEIYQYRTTEWIHFLPFSPKVILKKGESVSQWQEYYFFDSVKQAEELRSKAFIELAEAEFAGMKKALVAELKKAPLKPGCEMKLDLPTGFVAGAPEPSPAGKPEATVLLLRNGVYYHPSKVDALLWTSFDDCLKGMADVKGIKAELLIVSGASCNAEAGEFDLTKKAAALSAHEVVFAPNRVDAGNLEGFEKVFGKANWVRRIKDVTFVSYADNDPEWLRKTLDDNKGKRVAVIADSLRPDLSTQTEATLVMARQNTTTVSFNRIGNWPLVWNPPLQGAATVALIHIFPDFIEVYLKPVGGSFGPRLYVDKHGKSPVLGIPPFVKGKPGVKIAHVTDTQLALLPKTMIDGKPLDQENVKKAFAEINALKPDFVVNTGDLVNSGDSEEEWKLYAELRSALQVPVHEILGNHDWEEARVQEDGSVKYSIDRYLKYSKSPLVYSLEEKHVLFVGLATATATPDDLAKFREAAKKAKCTVLMYHDPINEAGEGYTWWSPKLYKAALELKPSIGLAGHTHRLTWNQKAGIHEFVGSALGWTKTGDPAWNGFFLHLFFDDQVVSSYKRLGCDDLFFTVVTPYREK